MAMSISRVSLCLIFLIFLTSPAVLCSRRAATDALEKKLKKEQVHSQELLVSGSSSKVDSSTSMTKTDEATSNSAISIFFKYKLPFFGWPFHKYAPFPMDQPAYPSDPATPSTGNAEEETEKVPSSPNKGDRDGGKP